MTGVQTCALPIYRKKEKSGTELIADDEIFVLAIGRYGILTGIKITAFIKNLYG